MGTKTSAPALKMFRRKMVNPLHWRKANQVVRRYTRDDLNHIVGARRLIGELAELVDVTLSVQERDEAAKWLVGCTFDPQSKKDRLMIWKQLK